MLTKSPLILKLFELGAVRAPVELIVMLLNEHSALIVISLPPPENANVPEVAVEMEVVEPELFTKSPLIVTVLLLRANTPDVILNSLFAVKSLPKVIVAVLLPLFIIKSLNAVEEEGISLAVVKLPVPRYSTSYDPAADGMEPIVPFVEPFPLIILLPSPIVKNVVLFKVPLASVKLPLTISEDDKTILTPTPGLIVKLVRALMLEGIVKFDVVP